MRMFLSRRLPVLALLLAAWATSARADSAPRTIDFRYPPTWWQTSICLPDDWQKTLVGKEGCLLYDFGGGPYNGFKTRITASCPGKTDWLRQELLSPRIPIVRTFKRSGPIEVTEEAFAVAPSLAPDAQPAPQFIERLDEGSTNRNWAAPTIPCDPAFKHIAVGWKQSIRYRFHARPDARYTVLFGLCEGYHPTAGQRILDLIVEGKTLKTVDMIAAHGRNVPALFSFPARDENGDGWIDLAVAAAKGSPDTNSILNVLWVFEGDAPAADQLLSGKSPRPALAHVECGAPSVSANPPRHDVVLMHLTNRDPAADRSIAPTITIESSADLAANRRITIGSDTSLLCTDPFDLEKANGRLILHVHAQLVSPGATRTIAFAVLRGRNPQLTPRTVAEALALRQQSEQYWKRLDLPYDKIQVPDAGIQALVDSSIRNIYQAREIKEGLPAFQVGPTCYRGLWVVDGSFLMESVALLGRGDEARNGIRYLLKRQGKDGGFMLIDGHWKETGIVLWAVSQHPRLTRDKAWLREVWPSVERGFAYIQSMRKNAAADPKAPNYGLIPAGFSDGGLGEKGTEYTNIYWTLAGLKAAVESAQWLGKSDQAAAWQKEYDDFYATFRRAADRDMKTDSHGNRCLPIYMINGLRVPPQKAQWAFLHAIYPGKVFSPDDPLVRGNMAMLRAVETEGLVRDTGWVARGVWNYFGSFYGHAWLWLGDREKAIDTLYAFGNHASPLLVWREEQMPQGEGDANCGDMPHNWASAEFIRLVRHMLVLERGQDLHLFEALPRNWLRPNATTRLTGIATEFGPMSLELRVSPDGRTAHLHLDPPTRNAPGHIILHLDGWSTRTGTVALPQDKPTDQEFPI